MLPTLRPGDVVLIGALRRLPRVGEIVLIAPPGSPDRRWIKRVRSRGNKSFSVASDNPLEGTDSRQLGSLTRDHLLGRLLLRLPRWPSG